MKQKTTLWSGISQERWWLLLFATLALFVGIILSNTRVLPLDAVSFVFFSTLLFLVALSRPGWAFLLLVAVIPGETINVFSVSWHGILLRPYQWLVVVIFSALAVRIVARRLPFSLFRPHIFDLLPLLLVGGAFLSAATTPVAGPALKQTLVLVSFVALYFLGRLFFHTQHDARQTAPFFVSSSLVVFGYALWQNIMSSLGRENFATMIDRPNATFAEADWLGMFLIVTLSAGLTFLWYVLSRSDFRFITQYFQEHFLIDAYLTFLCTILILTVARSAWLGAFSTVVIFLVLVGVKQRRKSKVRTLSAIGHLGLSVGLSFLLALASVLIFHLSPFQFFNRISSTATGLQKITVSCEKSETILPEKIGDIAELEQRGCRHILLEEIESERVMGHFVHEVFRPDPNISVRYRIYATAWQLIKAHPFLGIGWSNVATILGTDTRGAGLNASNIFLEAWLGSGLIGLLALLAMFGWIFWAALCNFWKSQTVSNALLPLFIFVSFFGLLVFDLFNSGILLGFFFLLLSLGAREVAQASTDHPM